jgi:hypothetical protein
LKTRSTGDGMLHARNVPLSELGTSCEGCKKIAERYGPLELGNGGPEQVGNSNEKGA